MGWIVRQKGQWQERRQSRDWQDALANQFREPPSRPLTPEQLGKLEELIQKYCKSLQPEPGQPVHGPRCKAILEFFKFLHATRW